jgi:serine O-acetyltransferase
VQEALWKTLRADVYRYRENIGWRAMVSAWWRDPGFRFTWYLRKVAFYAPRRKSVLLPLYLYHRLWLNRCRFRYGFDVSPTSSIGPGLYLGHFGGVVISPFAVIGANVNIAQGAVIGATSRGENPGAPTLEDRVWVGAHAIVVGQIHVGRAALIAPGAYVNFDVPENAVVLGNPGKIVSHKGSEGYVNRVLPVVESLQ